jgi:hypothetical protein
MSDFLRQFKHTFNCMLFLTVITSLTVRAQNSPSPTHRFSFEAGTGVGLYQEKNLTLRSIWLFGGYYNINEKISVGFEASISNKVTIYNPGGFDYDEATRTITYDPTNPRTKTMMGKLNYSYSIGKLKPYVGLGIGTSNLIKLHPIFSMDDLMRRNLAAQLEFGISLKHFRISYKFLHSGKTPEFYGMDDHNTTVILESIKVSSSYLTVVYQLHLIKRKGQQ